MRRAPDPAAGLHGRVTGRAGLLYRGLRLVWRGVGRLLGLRVHVEGLENLPRDARGRTVGGWIAAGLPHRTWIDPFVVWSVLPAEPRLAFFGDARAMARSPLRRLAIRLLGGVIPIPPGGGPRSFAAHLEAASVVIRSGGVFFLFPEVGPATPPGTARRLGAGSGYIALRTGAPIVPIVLGGSHELFLGRRIAVRILPPVTGRELAGLAAGSVPAPGSADERNAAHRIVEALHERTGAAVAEAHGSVEPAPGHRKRFRRLTTLFE